MSECTCWAFVPVCLQACSDQQQLDCTVLQPHITQHLMKGCGLGAVKCVVHVCLPAGLWRPMCLSFRRASGSSFCIKEGPCPQPGSDSCSPALVRATCVTWLAVALQYVMLACWPKAAKQVQSERVVRRCLDAAVYGWRQRSSWLQSCCMCHMERCHRQ